MSEKLVKTILLYFENKRYDIFFLKEYPAETRDKVLYDSRDIWPLYTIKDFFDSYDEASKRYIEKHTRNPKLDELNQ